VAKLEITGDVELGPSLDRETRPQFHVTLSKRNLLALLHKVDQDWSAKTLTNDMVFVHGELTPVGDVLFAIHCEPDEEHYGHEARKGAPAGTMIGSTEQFIAGFAPVTQDDQPLGQDPD
jgi:hypothetical protein